MDRDRENPDALSPSMIENKAFLRSIDEEGGESEGQMMQAALKPGLHDQLRTIQKPVSVVGWSAAIGVGLLLWALFFYLIG